jgi:hypothetical protein
MTENNLKKYTLSIGGLFRNEEDSIVEWIEHYLHHGTEHFYLIDDSSDDSSVEKIKPYIEKNIVTLFNYGNQWGRYKGRQQDLYNHYILPVIKETQWLLMVDVDEYVWSPIQINICELLMTQCMHLGQIQLETTLFGSSHFIEQPSNVVGNFIMRTQEHPTTSNGLGGYKYFVNTNFEFASLNVHHATFKDTETYENGNYFIITNPGFFVLNHYRIQSLDFWNNVKCTRGDSNDYLIRNLEEFYRLDINEVEDKRLYEQNKEWLDKEWLDKMPNKK